MTTPDPLMSLSLITAPPEPRSGQQHYDASRAPGGDLQGARTMRSDWGDIGDDDRARWEEQAREWNLKVGAVGIGPTSMDPTGTSPVLASRDLNTLRACAERSPGDIPVPSTKRLVAMGLVEDVSGHVDKPTLAGLAVLASLAHGADISKVPDGS